MPKPADKLAPSDLAQMLDYNALRRVQLSKHSRWAAKMLPFVHFSLSLSLFPSLPLSKISYHCVLYYVLAWRVTSHGKADRVCREVSNHALTCPKGKPSTDGWREEAVGQQCNSRPSIDDGKNVVGLKRSDPGGVVAAMKGPARSKIVPQRFVGPPCPHLHANLHIPTNLQPR